LVGPEFSKMAKADIDWPRERAACRASFDNACPGVTDDADKQQNTKHSSEKTINQSRRCPHCEGQNSYGSRDSFRKTEPRLRLTNGCIRTKLRRTFPSLER
jgi:hypothetical protein